MRFAKSFNVVGVHAEGEVGNVIVGGVGQVPGETMLDKRNYLANDRDWVRKMILTEPKTPIQDVHFLTKDEMYIRKDGHWKVMNPVEWDRMEDTSDWQIKPELGVEFLREYDKGGMTGNSWINFK